MQAPRDQNFIPALLGTSDIDGVTPVEIYADDTTNRLKVDSLDKETAPTDDSKNNGSMLISYNAAGDAVYVDEIISGVTYRQTFTRGDMVIDSTLPISAVEII